MIPPETGKTRITIRIDTEILDWFRAKVNEAGGGNYQTMINQALRDHIHQNSRPIEDVIRQVGERGIAASRVKWESFLKKANSHIRTKGAGI